jgi:integrase
MASPSGYFSNVSIVKRPSGSKPMGSRRGNGEGAIYSREQRRTLKDGTVVSKTIWCAAISLELGTRKVIYGRTREEVAAELVKLLGARNAGLPLPGVRLRTDKYLQSWLKDTVRPSRKPLTHEKYASVVANHIVPVIGKVPLARVGPEHVQKIQGRMLAQGLGTASVFGMRTTLSAALSQAERWNLISRNPVRLVDPPRRQETEPRVLTPEESAAFLAAARGDEFEQLFATMLLAGLRPAEARGLAWAHVHLSGSTPFIEVRQQVLELKNQTPALKGRRKARTRILDVPKSRHGRRSIPLIPMAVRVLQAQRACVSGLAVRGVADLVFPSDQGQPLVSRTVRDHFARIALQAGIQGATPHTLRHSTGTFLLAAGVPDRVVQDILGHGSAAVTRLYQHVTPAMLTDAAVKLQTYLEAVGIATPFATP